MKTLIAIDPGASGAIAVRDRDGGVFTYNMPDTIKDVWDELSCLNNSLHLYAIIEDAGYHIQGNNASASCKFARHCGALEMALTGLSIPWEAVRPQKWMKHYGALPKEKKDRKNKIKELMQRRYPNIKVTLANADALAILTFAIETPSIGGTRRSRTNAVTRNQTLHNAERQTI